MASVSFESTAGVSIPNIRVPVFYPAKKDFRNTVPDEELVERSLGGEEEAFRYLYERYWQPVYSVVCRIILDPEEARDMTQEVFCTVYRSLSKWSPQRAKFFSWDSY